LNFTLLNTAFNWWSRTGRPSRKAYPYQGYPCFTKIQLGHMSTSQTRGAFISLLYLFNYPFVSNITALYNLLD